MGRPVRFNGGHCEDPVLARDVAPYVDLVAMCPEVGSGLGAPRDALQLRGSVDAPRLVNSKRGWDETPRLLAWSRERMCSIDALGLDGFVLKKGSPTCGMERVRVHTRPDARPSYEGVGIFARELMERFPLLAVEEEGRLRDEGLRETFLTRVFGSRRWRTLASSAPGLADLDGFRAGNELLLLAHDPSADGDLRGLLAQAHDAEQVAATVARFGTRFLAALAQAPTPQSQGVVLHRLLDRVHDAGRSQRADLAAVIDEYLDGKLPLTVPARLLHHYLHDDTWADQTWFAPWPSSIVLRATIPRPPRAREARPAQWHVAAVPPVPPPREPTR